jgi:branched-chain amino acid transport system permease protein
MDGLTGGATGLNGIPKIVATWHIAAVLLAAVFLISRLSASPTGLAFDVIRQEETVAVSLGIKVDQHHVLAFAISGLVAGAAGGLMAGYDYSVVPEEFGFNMLVAALSFVVLGGRRSPWGPIAGAIVLTLLPEIARPLSENRMVIYGVILIVVIVYLPNGLVDTLLLHNIRSVRARQAAMTEGSGVE